MLQNKIKCKGENPTLYDTEKNTTNKRNLGRARGFVCGLHPGEENGNPHQYPRLGNPIDRGTWRATVRRVTKRQT